MEEWGGFSKFRDVGTWASECVFFVEAENRQPRVIRMRLLISNMMGTMLKMHYVSGLSLQRGERLK